MLRSTFSLPLYGVCGAANDERCGVAADDETISKRWHEGLLNARLYERGSSMQSKERRGRMISYPVYHGKGLSERSLSHCHLHKRFYCTLQPVQGETKQSGRKVAPGLEGSSLQSNGVLKPTEWKALPDVWRTAAEQFGDRVALVDPHHHPFTTMTFLQLRTEILEFAEGLRVAGVLPNEKIALFADNSCRWLVADQGIMAAGAIDAVRGTRSSIEELIHIYTHSDSAALVVDSQDLFSKLVPQLQVSTGLRFVILLWGENPRFLEGSEGSNAKVYTYHEILALGRERRDFYARMPDSVSAQSDNIQPEDVATLVYTSGTTGNPKGVMLTHANLLHQVQHLEEIVEISPGDRFVSLLPPWHMYERACEYFSLCKGIEQVYTNVKSLKDDLRKYSPDFLVAVPLVFDILYSGVQKQLLSGPNAKRVIAVTLINISMMYKEWKRVYEGKALDRAKMKVSRIVTMLEWVLARVMAALLFPLHMLAKFLIYKKIYAAVGIKKLGISGGGSLAPHVDRFFEAIDITILNGYGLTESSPVVAARVRTNNVLGTVGKPLYDTEIKVVDPETGETLPHGKRGLVKVRGPQIMKGYYKNPSATSQALDKHKWLDTGDLGWIVPKVEFGPARACSETLVLDGRAKDTIVLSTGENLEPTQIEEAALQSRYIQQIMVVGQDQRRLGALIVPNKEELQTAMVSSTDTERFIRSELNKYASHCPATIGPFVLIPDAFTIDSGLLTPTMKMRRAVIAERYSKQISDLFAKSNS